MNFVMGEIYRLESVAELQGLIRAAIVDGCDASAYAIDKALENAAKGYKLAALYIAYDLMRIMKRESVK